MEAVTEWWPPPLRYGQVKCRISRTELAVDAIRAEVNNMKGTLELQDIQQALERERATLVAQIDEAAEEQAQPAERLPEWLDSAEAETQHDIQAALLSQARRQLEQVEAALRRLAANSYGYCVVCGHAINPERLSALPYVLTCINCQQRDEAHSRA